MLTANRILPAVLTVGSSVRNLLTDDPNDLRLVTAEELQRRGTYDEATDSLIFIPKFERPTHESQYEKTHLGEALHETYRVLKPFVEAHPHGPAPRVVIISDGFPEERVYDARTEAERLKSLKTSDGPVFVMAIHTHPDAGDPKMFFKSPDFVKDRRVRNLARLMTDLASPITPAMQRILAEQYDIHKSEPGAKAIAINVSPDDIEGGLSIARLANFGTMGTIGASQ
jgi:hypothetical protein